MSFNVFGPTTKRDIRVGYISTERGYVKGLSVPEANQYAFRNPGTQFILETRDSTRYLNINQVNALTKADILPSKNASQNTCDGITGLDPTDQGTSNVGAGGNTGGTGGTGGTGTDGGTGAGNTNISNINNRKPIVYISGGGGVGAKGTPVIGDDGSLLDVLLTSGGFGYRYAPQVTITDPNRRGAGAVAISSLCVSTTPVVEEYTDEDDFEEYDFSSADETPGYGAKFGVDGEVTGQWDPTLYANLAEDPIGIEIQRYQDFLKQLKNPWWDTRKELPLSVTFNDKTTRVVHNVEHPAWAELVSKKTVEDASTGFVDIEFEVFVQLGKSDEHINSGLSFVFTSEDGTHTFKFSAKNYVGRNSLAGVTTKVIKKVKKNTTYKVTSRGKFRGKTVEQGLANKFGRKPKEFNPNNNRGSTVTGQVVFADLKSSANDNDDIQIKTAQGKFTATNKRKEGRSTFDLTYKFESITNKSVRVKEKTDSFMNKYAICPTPMSNVPGSDYAGRWCTFVWEENFPYTGEYIFRGMADNISKIYIDNDLIMDPKNFRGNPLPKNVVKKTVEAGVHSIKIDLFNKPQYETITTNETEKVKDLNRLPVQFDVFGKGSTENMEMKFIFTSSDGKHSFTLKNVEKKGDTYTKDIKLIPNMDYKVQGVMTGKSTYTGKDAREFNIKYKGLNAANSTIDGGRKLLRFKDGHGDDINSAFSIESSSPGVEARFAPDGRSILVRGNGDVTLALEWNDNPNTAGVAVKDITVGGETWKQRGKKGKVTKTISFNKSDKDVEKNDRAIEQGLSRAFGKKTKEGGDGTIIFADYVGSTNDNDDMQVRANKGIFVRANPRKIKGTSGRGTQTRTTHDLTYRLSVNLPATSSSSDTPQEVFNTLDYIKRADRKLWRTNHGGRGGFIHEYGVCPFDTRRVLRNNPYEGTHVIRWEHVSFPADGNYTIDIEVDDRVKLFIGNRTGQGAMKIGNGLKNIDNGGDEVIIEKNGFIGDSNKGTGKSTYTKFFKKGQYRIRAELYQKPGGRFGFDKTPNEGSLSTRFTREGNDMFLVVEGSGSGVINFSLKVDDNPRIAGDSLGSLRIGSVSLKRSRVSGRKRFKEQEIITGSGSFTAGEKYKIIVGGASAGVGRPRVIRNRIEFLDTGGADTNATLTVGRISDVKAEPIKGLNPMALAIRITAQIKETRRVSARTWHQNPFGAALTIEAPLPPIPESPKVLAEGRCPENPTWSTRFTGGSEKWWPVTHIFADGTRSWSKFMNRYAISPLPPLPQPGTAGGGIVYKNSWEIDVPYAGFHALKGAVDNGGRILVDDKVILQGGYFSESKFTGDARSLAGFRTVSPPFKKFFLSKGKHTITVEVENREQVKKRKIEKKIFSTQDWIKEKKGQGKVPVNFFVYGQGSIPNTSINMVFTSEDGNDSFVIKPKRDRGNTYNYEREVNVIPNVNYKVQAVATARLGQGRQDYPIKFEGLNSANNPIEVSGNNSRNQNNTLKLKDGHGGDANAKFTIVSTSPRVRARFSYDGKTLIVEGKGDVSIKLSWNDNPGTAGVAVRNIKIGNKTWEQRGRKGEVTRTLSLTEGGSSSLVPEQGTLKRGSFGSSQSKGAKESGGKSDVIFADIIGSANDNDDMQIRCSTGEFTPSNKRKGIQGTSGQGTQKRNTFDLTFRVESEAKTVRRNIDGVRYLGPELFQIKTGAAAKLWSKFMLRNAVSPFIPPINADNPRIADESFNYTWKNVNFPESGRYKILFQADNIGMLLIDGQPIKEVRSFRGDPEISYAEISAGTYEVTVICTNGKQPRNVLTGNNPTGFALKIMKDVIVSESLNRSWQQNPVGISAILVPPPCPKVIEGVGSVCEVIVKEPGNGFVKPPGKGVPAIIDVKDVEVKNPGINYKPSDKMLVNGTPVDITTDGFGRVTGVKLPSTAIITSSYPSITLPSDTGIGFRGTPLMRTNIVPEDVFDEELLVQVTDLPGLKQTGYVNGKPYYGSVFSKDGQLFAGIYETIGELIPVYATLQESIDNQITTRPSAIIRQGTDVTSNDPRLNIPGTPQNLI